jgi:hypothetical protein
MRDGNFQRAITRALGLTVLLLLATACAPADRHDTRIDAVMKRIRDEEGTLIKTLSNLDYMHSKMYGPDADQMASAMEGGYFLEATMLAVDEIGPLVARMVAKEDLGWAMQSLHISAKHSLENFDSTIAATNELRRAVGIENQRRRPGLTAAEKRAYEDYRITCSTVPADNLRRSRP